MRAGLLSRALPESVLLDYSGRDFRRIASRLIQNDTRPRESRMKQERQVVRNGQFIVGRFRPLAFCDHAPSNPRLKTDVENARLSGSLIRHGLAAWRYA